jgi:hypothetical protein
MVALSAARLIVATIPFKRWQNGLGGPVEAVPQMTVADAASFAAHVEWAAKRLPFSTKCLPRAMALSWILRSRKIAHCVVFAVRPAELRGSNDQLHAWVEIGNEKIIGELPGPWIETLRLGT